MKSKWIRSKSCQKWRTNVRWMVCKEKIEFNLKMQLITVPLIFFVIIIIIYDMSINMSLIKRCLVLMSNYHLSVHPCTPVIDDTPM